MLSVVKDQNYKYYEPQQEIKRKAPLVSLVQSHVIAENLLGKYPSYPNWSTVIHISFNKLKIQNQVIFKLFKTAIV